MRSIEEYFFANGDFLYYIPAYWHKVEALEDIRPKVKSYAGRSMKKIVGFIALSAAFLLLAGTALEKYTHPLAKNEMLRRDNRKGNLEALEKADKSGEYSNLLLPMKKKYWTGTG